MLPRQTEGKKLFFMFYKTSVNTISEKYIDLLVFQKNNYCNIFTRSDFM